MKYIFPNFFNSFCISIITLSIILIAIFFSTSKIKLLNNNFYDFKIKICGKFRPDVYQIRKKIVTIFIDDIKTIPEIGYPSPLIHAEMIKKLSSFNVKFIFYDFIFRGETPQSLIQATKDAGNVYWPVSFYLNQNNENALKISDFSQSFQEIIKKNSLIKKNENHNLSGLWHAGLSSLANENLLNNSKGIGHISTGNDENETNNVFRKVALIINIDGYLFPSIDLIIACDYFNVEKNNVKIKSGESIILPNAKLPDGKFSDIEIPINEHGEMLINYIKPWEINEHDFLEPFWFVSVLNSEGKPERENELKIRFKDKICLVGNASSINKDIHIIPIDTNYPGIGIHSHILYTILSGTFIREISPISTWILLCIIIVIFYFITSKRSGLTAFFISLISIFLYFIFSYAIFIVYGFSFVDLIPISGLLLSGSLNLIGDIFVKEKKIEKLEHELISLDSELYQKNIIINKTQNELIEETTKREASQIKIQELENILKIEKNCIEKIKKEQMELQNKISELINKTTYEIDISEISQDNQKLINECSMYGIVTRSENMLELFKIAKKIADSDKPVLILGESGTGKEVFAQAIHKMSPRKNNPMIVVNIPAINDSLLESTLFGHVKGSFTGATENKKGKFELADKSTVFLDEIGDMKQELQSKLLRVLQEKTIDKVGDNGIYPISLDIRIIAATNKDLYIEIQKKLFREDLYYRLNVFTIKLPALRERKDDIPYLVKHLIAKSKYPDKKISQKAILKLISYSWEHNNIRELENILSRALELSEKPIIQAEDLQLPEKQDEINIFLDMNILKFSSTPDEVFWKIMEKNNFEIGIIADISKQSRGTISSRFKGICFQKLSENKWDINVAAEKLANNLRHRELLKERFNEYYQNVLSVINEYTNRESAKEECQRRFKNLPKKYHKYIEELIDIKIT